MLFNMSRSFNRVVLLVLEPAAQPARLVFNSEFLPPPPSPCQQLSQLFFVATAPLGTALPRQVKQRADADAAWLDPRQRPAELNGQTRVAKRAFRVVE
jgi:hypothetical protein